MAGDFFSFYTDFVVLNAYIEEWKQVLIEESGYVTEQQEQNWRYCGADYGGYFPCFYQHGAIQACLSILQREESNDKINEALIDLEGCIKKAADDSVIAAKNANINAAFWIDAWLRKNANTDVTSMMQAYRNAYNTEQIDKFIQCWSSGELYPQNSFDVNDKLECAMYVLFSERANFAATFGGNKSILGYSKRGYCFAPDYISEINLVVHKHFSEDEVISTFIKNRLTQNNRWTICLFLFPIDKVWPDDAK